MSKESGRGPKPLRKGLGKDFLLTTLSPTPQNARKIRSFSICPSLGL